MQKSKRLSLSFVFGNSKDQCEQSKGKHDFDSHGFPDINGNFAGNDMIPGKGLVDVFIPVNWKKLCNPEDFFIHDIYWNKDTRQETYAKGNDVCDSIEHVVVFHKKANQICQ